MKLLTLNAHAWLEENQDEKINILVDAIINNDYDVICLQEVNQYQDDKILFDDIRVSNFAQVVVDRLKLNNKEYDYCWCNNHYSYSKFEEGTAVITKHPIVNSFSVCLTRDCSVDSYRTRKAMVCDIKISDEIYRFVSVHLGWWDDEIEPAKEMIDKLLGEVVNDKTILMGDFNNEADVRNQGYDYLLNNNIYDTYQYATKKDDGYSVLGSIAGWEKSDHNKRIDFIFTTYKPNVSYHQIIFNGENYEVVSDHFGVECELINN